MVGILKVQERSVLVSHMPHSIMTFCFMKLKAYLIVMEWFDEARGNKSHINGSRERLSMKTRI